MIISLEQDARLDAGVVLRRAYGAVGELVSINVGQPRQIDVRGKSVQSSIYKTPLSGVAQVDKRGLIGDTRADRRRMGEAHHALYAYPYEHYAHWAQRYSIQLEPGQFGENLTLRGLPETSVRIGDVLECGTSILQVAQPRIPCRKLDSRMGFRFSKNFLKSRKVGYYLRVLRPGSFDQHAQLRVLSTDPNSPTIDEFVRLVQFDYWDAAGLASLLRARDLMQTWREIIEAKLGRARGASGWFGLRPLRVVEREQLGDMVALRLACARGRTLPLFQVGQHLPLALGENEQQRVLGHAYLLSGAADPTSYRILANSTPALSGKPANGTLSLTLPHQLRSGDTVMAGAPRGACFDLFQLGQRTLVLTEGVGLSLALAVSERWPERTNARLDCWHVRNGMCSPTLESMLTDQGSQTARIVCVDAYPALDHSQASAFSHVLVAGSSAFVDRMLERMLLAPDAELSTLRYSV